MLAQAKQAIHTTWQLRFVVLLHYVASIATALVAIFPLQMMLQSATQDRDLGRYDNNLFSYDFVLDFHQYYRDPFNLNIWIGILAILLFASFNYFLSGGTFSAIRNPQQSWRDFWSECAHLFPNYVVALALLTLLWSPVLMLFAWLGLIFSDWINPPDIIMPYVLHLMVMAPAIFCWHRSIDLARVHLANWPEDGVLGACFAALFFVVNHIGKLIAISLIYLIPIGLLSLLGSSVLTGPVNGGFFVFLLFAVLTQLSVALRFYLRVAFMAHESHYYTERHR